MRVLVTGGGGFIGSHVVDRLIERGMTPRIFDLSASPYHSPLEVETFTGSITDPANLNLAMRDCDAVIHLAAVADVAHVLADPVLAEEVNTRGTLNVLEAACRSEVGRVVYGSTTWVYSDCLEQAVSEETPIPAPRHLYTATKLAGETYCAGYAELFDLESTVLRFGIPYGPRARAAGVVAKFTDLALAGEALTIAGDGSQCRSFIYVEDLAAGVVAGLQPAGANRTYNLSGDEVVTILEIAETVQEMTGGCEIVHTPPRPGDFPGKEISNARALEELGWKAETSFREGVRRYVEWVRNTQRPPDPVPGKRPSLNGNGHAAGALLAGASGLEERPPRVLVLTADIGEGHDLPARIIAADIEQQAPDAEVEIVNGLEAMGRIVAGIVRGGSRVTFRWMPWVFDIQYWLLTKFAPTRWLAHHLGYVLGAHGLMKLIAEHDPDVVVSTYPGRHRGARDAAREPPPADPGPVGDHRPRRPALLGAPGGRPPLRHPPRVDRGGREAGRPGERRVDAAADIPRLPDAAHPRRRPQRPRRPRPRPDRAGLRRRLGGGRPRGGDPLRALGRGHAGRLHHRPQRGRPASGSSSASAITSGCASSASPSR